MTVISPVWPDSLIFTLRSAIFSVPVTAYK